MEWTAEGRHRLTVHIGFLANLERKERTLLQGASSMVSKLLAVIKAEAER